MFVLRARPNEYWLRRFELGNDQGGTARGPSRKWWRNGALVVDDAGPAIIDADGYRIAIPVPPAGGMLVRSVVGGSSSSYGSSPTMFFYFVADPDGRVTARLPGETDGFTEDGLKDFARAAGMGFTEIVRNPVDAPGYSKSVNFDDCIFDRDYRASRRSRMKRALRYEGRCSPYREPFSSMYPAEKPPYELPEMEVPF